MTITPADLPLNPDGSVYHLNLLPQDISDTIILVGDPHRAIQIAGYFEAIETKKQKRELITYTGTIRNKRLTVIGTGMGIGNIDIVMNELDALVNIDLTKREIKPKLSSLKIIRLGTAGGLQASQEIGSYVVSSLALGFDNLLDFYVYPYSKKEQAVLAAAKKYFSRLPTVNTIYCAKGDTSLITLFGDIAKQGFTLTSTGFYGPQFREVRAPKLRYDFLDAAREFIFEDEKILNLEMETAAIYGLGRLLGHQCCSISAIIGNRTDNTFTDNGAEIIHNLIEKALQRLT